MATKHRKIRKKRGSRSCGGGSHKKRRGAGHRGGRGAAGTHKGKWTWVIKYDPEHFGDRGFKLPQLVKHEYAAINVGELDELAERIAEKEKRKLIIDVTKLNCEKVLGKGKISKPLVVKALSFSKSALKKIESSGGEAVLLKGAE
ncbi:MAG: uL15 family ribosomal protein [Candidatus Hydrothermarchaeota archaeon]|nr:uL15 family ribosomal protein [Candidatus Hydrothermarchaeota archaeon]